MLTWTCEWCGRASYSAFDYQAHQAGCDKVPRADKQCCPNEGESYCTEKDAEIARLTAERDAAIKRSEYWKAEHLAANAAVDAAIQRAERAERVAVEAIKRRAHTMDYVGMLSIQSRDFRKQINIKHDGTDADLYRALVEACEGAK